MNVDKYISAGSTRVNDDRVYSDSKKRPVGLATKIIKLENGQVRMDKPHPRDAPFVTPQDKRAGITKFIVYR